LTAIEKPINQYLVDQLLDLGVKTTHLVIATDWDAQGESIGYQIKNYIEQGNGNQNTIVTSRMRFTATNVPSLIGSFKKQVTLDTKLVKSVDSLRRQDLRMGASLTRFLTVGIQKLGFSRLISYGPCQSSVLWIVTQRFMEKKEFVPLPYWEITASFEQMVKKEEAETQTKTKKKGRKRKKTTKTKKKPTKKNQEIEKFIFLWKKNPVSKETELKEWNPYLGKITRAKLVKQTRTMEKIPRPKPLDTDTLESEGSRLFKVSPKLVADIAEKLYNNGFITYPRTESSYYLTKDLSPLCEKFIENQYFSEMAKLCLNKGMPKDPSKGRFTKDHEPISPVKSATEKDISNAIKGNDFENSLAWRIYEYIVRRFFATVYIDGEIEKLHTIIEVNKEEFVHDAVKITKFGFLDIFPYKKVQEKAVPFLKLGTSIEVEIDVEKKYTTPPDLWTEGRIIREMARLNIGTDATRSQHIATVIERGYVRVQSGSRTLIPTEIGITFYTVFMKFAEKLILPEIREIVEQWTLGIRTDEITEEEVDKNVIELTKTSLTKLKENSDQIFPLFATSIKKTTREGEEFGICKVCNEKLILKSSTKGKRYLLCSNEECKTSYPLPKKGELSLLPEKCHACPMYPLQVGTGTKTWIFCPNCWIDRQNSEGLLFCSKCQIETCPYSAINNSYSNKQEKGKLGECPECHKGQIVLYFDEWRTKLECNNESCDNSYKAPNIRAGTSIQIDLNCKLCNLSTLLIKRKGKATYNMCPVCSLLCFQCIHRCFG
jgi:DNA topoisomerase IA/ssDNA-binding Zn-finger/Zn-ribbon topoisomerase 1